MRHDVGCVLLVEERDGVKYVERVAVGEFHRREGCLLGQDLVDVRRQQRVCCEQRVAEGALDRGLEFLFGRGGDAGGSLAVDGRGRGVRRYSFLNIVAVGGVLTCWLCA